MVYMAGEIRLTRRLIEDVQGVCMARECLNNCHDCKYYGEVCKAICMLHHVEKPKNLLYYGGKENGF